MYKSVHVHVCVCALYVHNHCSYVPNLYTCVDLCLTLFYLDYV